MSDENIDVNNLKSNYKLFKTIEICFLDELNNDNKTNINSLNYVLNNLTESQSSYIYRNLNISDDKIEKYKEFGVSQTFVDKYHELSSKNLIDGVNFISKKLLDMQNYGNTKPIYAGQINDKFEEIYDRNKEKAIIAIASRVQTLPADNELSSWLKHYRINDEFINKFVEAYKKEGNDRLYDKVITNTFVYVDNYIKKELDKVGNNVNIDSIIQEQYKKLPENDEFKHKFISDLNNKYSGISEVIDISIDDLKVDLDKKDMELNKGLNNNLELT